jgi:hypothetical protein
MISTAKLTLLLSAMATVESGDNPNAYNARENAHGILQIRQCVLDDVNRHNWIKVNISAAYYPPSARDIARSYLEYWCSYNQQYSFESAARTWNGGPDGWWKLSTLPYWAKVKKELEARGLDSADTILATPTQPKAAPTQTWQPPQINPLPAGPSTSTPATAGESLSRSDLVTTFRFALNASEAKELRSVSVHFTIKPSESKPAVPRVLQPPTLVPAKIRGDGVVFKIKFIHSNP